MLATMCVWLPTIAYYNLMTYGIHNKLLIYSSPKGIYCSVIHCRSSHKRPAAIYLLHGAHRKKLGHAGRKKACNKCIPKRKADSHHTGSLKKATLKAVVEVNNTLLKLS